MICLHARNLTQNKRKFFHLNCVTRQVPFNSDRADYIKGGIRARIQKSSITIVMASDDTHKSDWVDWEINETIRMGKGVVVIDARKNSGIPLPSAVGKNKSKVKVVPWEIDKVMKAIDDATK